MTKINLTKKEEELYNLLVNKIGVDAVMLIHKKHLHEFEVSLEEIRENAISKIKTQLDLINSQLYMINSSLSIQGYVLKKPLSIELVKELNSSLSNIIKDLRVIIEK